MSESLQFIIYHIFTRMDSKIAISTQQSGHGFYLAQFKTPQLTVFTYYVESKGECILIDPPFDTLVLRELIQKRNSTLKYVFLTHYHADFLSGHNQFKVPIVMGKGSRRQINKFQVHQQQDGSIIELGDVKIKVIHTPGHTLESSTFLLFDHASAPVCLFTGDTLFLGDVGRPDLAANSELAPSDLAGLLFDSVQKLKALQGDIRVYPAHGAGSSCGKSISAGNFCTLQNQKANNYALKIAEKQEFVQFLLNGMPRPPKYFFHDAKLNQIGFNNFDQALKQANNPLSVEEFANLAQKATMVDTRNEVQVLIKGAFWLPSKGAMAGWLSNYFVPETELLLITQAGKWQDTAERFFRIGYFNIRGYNNFAVNQWKGDLVRPKIIKFQQFLELKDFQHLDVRNEPEFKAGGVVENSILVPLPELRNRVQELKGRKNLVVSCRTGLRARVAFSVLAQIDLEPLILAENFDDFAKKQGIKVVPYPQV